MAICSWGMVRLWHCFTHIHYPSKVIQGGEPMDLGIAHQCAMNGEKWTGSTFRYGGKPYMEKCIYIYMYIYIYIYIFKKKKNILDE